MSIRRAMSQDSSRVRMRMNRNTVALVSTLSAMWYAAASQSNGAIYLLTFASSSIGLLSWIFARWNLSRVEFAVLAHRPGSNHLPFRIRNSSSRKLFSLEVATKGGFKPIYVRQLDPSETHHGELLIPKNPITEKSTLNLVIRSLYPLGFFTAEKKIQVTHTDRQAPEGEGSLPLPEPQKNGHSLHSATQGNRGSGNSAGDDFAGVRAWQLGDSPRQIDWKAAARERPLMTKQWTSDVPSVINLDWNALDLPQASRVRQMIRWMEQCEQDGLVWSLQLPDRTVGPGRGTQHASECRLALAKWMPNEIPKAASSNQRPIPTAHETTSIVPHTNVTLLCVSLLLTLVPMVGEVSLIGMAFLLLGAGLRVSLHGRVVPLYARLALMVIGGAVVFLTEPEHRSMEAATALLFVFIGGKMLESRTPRDFQVLAILGWFLCMCSLSMEQSLGWTLYTACVFFIITTAWLRLREGSGEIRSTFGSAAALLVQAMPFVLLMFFLFPRGTERFINTLARRGGSQSGLSNVLEPGSVARIALSSETAFLAEFPEGNPAPPERYWRALVLWQCEGLRWTRGRPYVNTVSPSSKDSRLVEQRITLKPHGDLWLPALDRVDRVIGTRFRALIDEDGAAIADRPVDTVLRYTAESHSPLPSNFLSDVARKQATQVPPTISGEVENLASTFRPTPQTTDEEAVNAALDYLRDSGFQYTLEPGIYEGGEGLEEFVIRRKLGFCEHFSAAFATLMRLIDIPSRVVIGFLGGEFRESRNHWVVRNSDAHAWVEVWLKGKGWTRVDPTAALAPGRLSGDLQTFLAGGAESDFVKQRDTWWWQMWIGAQDVWDQLNFEWYDRVVTADDDTQRDDLDRLGLVNWNWPKLILTLSFGIALFILPLVAWLRQKGRHPDPSTRLWLHVCARLARAGVPRQPGEGASTFASRAGAAFPEAAESLRKISQIYNEVRFGPRELPKDDLRAAVAQFPRLKPLPTIGRAASSKAPGFEAPR
jgi:protein-glutamine gamma-glutamyltransferase